MQGKDVVGMNQRLAEFRGSHGMGAGRNVWVGGEIRVLYLDYAW
jgi:hypothetical protein